MAGTVELHAVGESAVLAEFDTLELVMAAQDALRSTSLPGVVDIVAAASTVLVRCEAPASVQAVRALLQDIVLVESALRPGPTRIINTVYDGGDLAEAARLAGLSCEALVLWHSGQKWRAAFGGFAPGFMYLTPSGQPLAIPRRQSPRTVVPAGSVAVGGEFSAIYPGPSPGGWQLLGRCVDVLWDAGALVPSLIQPSDMVQFKPVRELLSIAGRPIPGGAPVPTAATGPPAAPAAGASPITSSAPSAGLLVISPGPFTTVQDLGRPGFAHLGVTASGALDRAGLRRANRMVGGCAPDAAAEPGASTGPGAAGLEIVMGGLAVQADGTHVVAVAGSAVELRVKRPDGTVRAAPPNAPFLLLDGETLSIQAAPPDPGRPGAALRSYLAVRGGIALPPVLGSRSTDVLSGLGPAVVRAGDFLPVAPSTAIVGWAEAPPAPQGTTVLRFLPGPRHNWFTAESLERFEQLTWRVRADSNRIGLRLEPAGSEAQGLQRTGEALAWELPSEGMVDGAIQVPPSGMPVLFLADHPVTGGYPVLGVVLGRDLGRAAGLAPGAPVRFRRADATGDGRD